MIVPSAHDQLLLWSAEEQLDLPPQRLTHHGHALRHDLYGNETVYVFACSRLLVR
mgnify:CR=1 FL=1